MSSTDSRRAELTPLKKRAVLEVYGHKCAVSGLTAEAAPIHVDHIVPLFCGGSNDWENLIPVTAHINLQKGKTRYEPQLEAWLKCLAAKHVPQVQRKYEQLSHRKIGIPENPAKIDLDNLENILFTAKTGFWITLDKIVYLVREYVKRGVLALEVIAAELGTTLASVRAKLIHIGIYRRDYLAT